MLKDKFIKIKRRLQYLKISLASILKAIIFEPKKHPWRLVIDTLLLSSTSLHKRSFIYLKKYCSLKETADQILVEFDSFTLSFPIEYKDTPSKLRDVVVLYYDIVYPTLVKNPINLLITEGPYELQSVRLEEGDVVIDAGANIGFFSFYAGNKVDSGKVYSFEPIMEVSKKIQQSRKYNNNNIIIVNKALGLDTKKTTFFYDLDHKGGSAQDSFGEPLTVQQTSIDKFVFENKLKKIDFIKMDIEGMEPDALKGARDTIAQFKPKLAICTYHDPSHPKEIEEIILEIRPDYNILHKYLKIYAW